MWDQWDTLTNLNLGNSTFLWLRFISFSHCGTDIMVRCLTCVFVVDNKLQWRLHGENLVLLFLVKKVRSVLFHFWLVTKRLKWKSHIFGERMTTADCTDGLWCNYLKNLQMISQYFQNRCLGTYGADRVGTLGTPTSHLGQPILIYKAAELTVKAFPRSFTLEKITSSFRETSSLNPNMITHDMFFHSVATENL